MSNEYIGEHKVEDYAERLKNEPETAKQIDEFLTDPSSGVVYDKETRMRMTEEDAKNLDDVPAESAYDNSEADGNDEDDDDDFEDDDEDDEDEEDSENNESDIDNF